MYLLGCAVHDRLLPFKHSSTMDHMQRALITIGVVFLLAGILWPWLAKLGLGRLPGDIRIESESGGFYFPIVTCIVVSIVLSIIVWFLRR